MNIDYQQPQMISYLSNPDIIYGEEMDMLQRNRIEFEESRLRIIKLLLLTVAIMMIAISSCAMLFGDETYEVQVVTFDDEPPESGDEI